MVDDLASILQPQFHSSGWRAQCKMLESVKKYPALIVIIANNGFGTEGNA